MVFNSEIVIVIFAMDKFSIIKSRLPQMNFKLADCGAHMKQNIIETGAITM